MSLGYSQNQTNQLENKDEGSETGVIQQAATQLLAQQLWTEETLLSYNKCTVDNDTRTYSCGVQFAMKYPD